MNARAATYALAALALTTTTGTADILSKSWETLPRTTSANLAAAAVANHEELGLEAFRHSRQLRRDHVRLLQDQPRRHSMGPGGLGCLSQDRVGLLDALLGGAVLWGVPVQTFRQTREVHQGDLGPEADGQLKPELCGLARGR